MTHPSELILTTRMETDRATGVDFSRQLYLIALSADIHCPSAIIR